VTRAGSGRGLPASVPVRHPLRAVDGLRGLPAHPRSRGIPPHRRQLCLGLSTAILVDAVIVRSALLPALMQMSGKANWWFPGWLDRMLPHLHMESEDADAELAEAAKGEALGVSQPRQNPGLPVFALFLSVPVATLFPTSRFPRTAHGAATSGPRAPGLWPSWLGRR
jgi:hypothetical protein